MISVLWGAALVVNSIRVQVHSIDALPVARVAFPSKRIASPGVLIELCASIQNVLIEVAMTLRRRHEPHRAVYVSSRQPVRSKQTSYAGAMLVSGFSRAFAGSRITRNRHG